MSRNGRFVAFTSAATNLVAGDSNGRADVFMHDRDADGDGGLDELDAFACQSRQRRDRRSRG